MKIEIKSEEHWHELRKKNIGGSEIASLFDCGYQSKFELYQIKKGAIKPNFAPSERMIWGNLLEAAIVEGVKKIKGIEIVEGLDGYYMCEDTPGMACTPDKFIKKDGKLGILQIKNISVDEYRRWEDGQPPLKFLLQVQHEIACTGAEFGMLACLIGGNELKTFEYDKHPIIAKIKEAVVKFWEDVTNDNEPKITGDGLETVKKLYRGTQLELIDLSGDNELATLCAGLEQVKAEIKKLTEEEKFLRANILQKMGDNALVKCGDFELSNKQQTRKGFSVEASTINIFTLKNKGEKQND